VVAYSGSCSIRVSYSEKVGTYEIQCAYAGENVKLDDIADKISMDIINKTKKTIDYSCENGKTTAKITG